MVRVRRYLVKTLRTLGPVSGRICPRAIPWIRHSSLDLLLGLLTIYRRTVLRHVMFIGVTGSCGKTTTKELISAVLATTFSTDKNRDTLNTTREVVLSVLRARKTNSHFVHELSIGKAYGRPTIEGPLKLLSPAVGVVINIGTDHRSLFGTQRDIAAEKGKLVASLPKEGLAVLNADDPLVLEMAARCPGRVVTYGTGPDSMVRATDVCSAWPERLTFTVHWNGESHPVHTQLCGTHWVHSVLAALAVGVSLGVPLSRAAEAIKEVAPFPGRMSPTELPTRTTLIRDDTKAPILSFPPAFEFIRQATASRKIVVVGTISDYWGTSKNRYVQIAQQACAVADYVFFVGPWAPRCLSAKKGVADRSLQAFGTLHQLADHLRTFLQAGDLVLVKGSPADRLESLVPLLTGAAPAASPAPRWQGISPGCAGPGAVGTQVVVGLGNQGGQYASTRHNIGHCVVEMMAAQAGAVWKREDQAMVALAEIDGHPVRLVKLLTSMNTSGPALKGLGERLEFEAEDCVLVYDDMDLPVGKVRERLRGGAGGHNGVLSIITTFQSEEFRRVKLGIGRPSGKADVKSFVLSNFTAAEEPVARDAVRAARTLVSSALAKRGILASKASAAREE